MTSDLNDPPRYGGRTAAELKALCDAATPGPWHYDSYRTVFVSTVPTSDNQWDICRSPTLREGGRAENNPDLALIAASRSAIPEMLEEIKRFRGVLDLLRQVNETLIHALPQHPDPQINRMRAARIPADIPGHAVSLAGYFREAVARAEAAEASLAAANAEIERLTEAAADARSTLDAWFERRKLGEEAVNAAVVDAAKGYLRTSRNGGMPVKLADAAQAVVDDMARLGIFADLFARAYLQTPLAEANRRIEELEEALRPFAKMTEAFLHRYETTPGTWREARQDDPDSYPAFGMNGATITLGDLRRARSALTKEVS